MGDCEGEGWTILDVSIQRHIHFIHSKCKTNIDHHLHILLTEMQLLLFAISTPAYILLLYSRQGAEKMELPDLVFSRVLMGLVLLEFFADQQQWGMINLPYRP